VRAAENSNDAALGSLRSAEPGHAPELRQYAITVHGVFDGVAGNEDVAVKLRHGLIRYNEAVAIMVEDEAALDLIAGGDLRGMFWWLGIAAWRVMRLFGLAARKQVPTARKLLNGAALFQLGEHFEEKAVIAFPKMESAGDFVRGGGRAPNLQKTQDVIGAQMGGTGHGSVS
jgi:hypothetical protein